MKFAVAREQLEDGLFAMQNVVTTRAALPIMSHVMFQADKGKLVLTATDLEITISRGLKARIEETGNATLPARKLYEIVRSLSAPEIEMGIDEKNICSLKAGASSFRIHGMAPDDFPPLPRFSEQRKFRVNQEWLHSAIRRTIYAVSEESSRYVLNGILFHIRDGKLALVGTDGRRMGLMDQEPVAEAEEELRVVMPTRSVQEMQRLLSKETHRKKRSVEVCHADKQISFTMIDEDEKPTHFLMSKIVDGSFPDYRRVIPKETNFRITVERDEFMRALKLAGTMTNDKISSINMILDKNRLLLEGEVPEEGESHVPVAINYEGKKIEMALNHEFLLEPLREMEADQIHLNGTDDLSPLLINDSETTHFLYVIMPLRAN